MLKSFQSWLVLAVLSSPLRAQGPTSQPADHRASPKAALKTFAVATRDADAQALRSCLHATSALEEKMAGAMVEMIVAVSRLRLAAMEKYGPANAAVFQGDIPTDEDLKRLDNAEERVNGDQALVTVKDSDQNTPMRLLRVEGQWKIPVGPSIAGQKPEIVEAQIHQMRSTAAATSQVAQAIDAGQYASPQEAIAALQEKLRAVQQ